MNVYYKNIIGFLFFFPFPSKHFLKPTLYVVFLLTSVSALGGSCMSTSCSLLSPHTQYLELFLSLRSRSSVNTCQMKERSNSTPNTVFLSFLHFLISLPLMVLQPFLTVHTDNLKFGALFEVYGLTYLQICLSSSSLFISLFSSLQIIHPLFPQQIP